VRRTPSAEATVADTPRERVLAGEASASQVWDWLEAFGRHNPAAVFVRDAEGHYLWANQTYARLLHVDSAEQVIGRHLTDFDPPGLAARYREEDRRVLATGQPLVCHIPFRRIPDGPDAGAAGYEEGVASGYRFPVVLDRYGRVVGAVFVDVSDRTRAEQARTEAEQRYRSLFDRLPLPLAALDAGGTVLDANPAMAGLLKRSISDLRGCPVSAFVDDAEALARVRTGCGSHRLDLHRPDRGSVPAEVDLIATGSGGPGRARTFILARPVGPVRLRAGHPAAVGLSRLQERLLLLLAEGHTNQRIAGRLGIARQTLDHHLNRLRTLLGAPSRSAVVARAYHLGLVDPRHWPPRLTTGHRPPGP
jgi:PAS domain-containing protein